MNQPRASGILLHPSALPGPHGIGTLGAAALAFVDFLADAGQSVWQMLPLGPTGYGDSPYNALSAFAGNPALIDLPTLAAWGDLDPQEIAEAADGAGQVDFHTVNRFRRQILPRAAARFLAAGASRRRGEFADYCAGEAGWLDDYALFSALHDHFHGSSWQRWPAPLRHRDPTALATWRERLAAEIATAQYLQYAFAVQWRTLREHAARRGVRLFGDLPIFVALDSADVWANQDLFRLDGEGQPTVVAGVPPDYFSATGQRWGNPLYRWEAHAARGYDWWLRRIRHELRRADLVRIDHFRGFQACWVIPANEPTAVNGRWEDAPGEALFATLQHALPALPIVAEDLGVITPEVDALRRQFSLPGMKILQFAFDSGADNPYLPHNFESACVVYTGTHDNATTRGWWEGLTGAQRTRIAAYLGKEHPEIPWDLIRLAMASVARLCIIPCQDLLALDDAARFNRPGTDSGNWSWRLTEGQLTAELARRLRAMSECYRRSP